MRWKAVLAGLLVLVVVVVVGLYVVVLTYDYDKLIPGLVKSVKESTGRELVAAGQASFKIGLTPELTPRCEFPECPLGLQTGSCHGQGIHLETGTPAAPSR